MRDPTPPSDLDTSWLDASVGYQLRRASSAMATDYARAAGDARLRPVLVTMLGLIAANPGIGQTELGQVLGIQRTNLAPLASELTDRGLIERRRSPTDGRRLALHLTAAGRASLRSGLALIDEHERRMTAALTGDERDVLLALLARIR